MEHVVRLRNAFKQRLVASNFICKRTLPHSPAIPRFFSSSVAPAVNFKDELFSFTYGRFLWNEKEQTASRYVEFDIDAMKDIACKAVGAKCCTKFVVHEDTCNRCFYMVLDDSIPLIARIPFDHATPISSTTASDVATLTFLREVLQCAVPAVVAWSANTTNNPVGREFMIMTHISGIPLQNIWKSISGRQVASLMMQLFIQTEAIPGSVQFSQNGSLYFKEDVSPELQSRPLFSDAAASKVYMEPQLAKFFKVGGIQERLELASEQYRIGPLAENDLWRRGRSTLSLDRGPWPSMTHYLNALAQNQIQWLKAFAEDGDRVRRPPFHTRDYHIEILRIFQDVIPFITPSDPNEEPHALETPTLWKSDIILSDVILSDESSENIAVFNGWKNAHILPYCVQAFPQRAFLYNGDMVKLPIELIPLQDVEVLLEEYKKKLGRPIQPEEEARFRLERKLAGRHRVYQNLMALENRRVDVALSKHCWNIRNLASEIYLSWENSIVPLRQTLFTLYDQWGSFTNYPAPMSLVKLVQRREGHERECDRYQAYSERVKGIERQLGYQVDGLLEGHDIDYEGALGKLRQHRLEWDKDYMGGPFRCRMGNCHGC